MDALPVRCGEGNVLLLQRGSPCAGPPSPGADIPEMPAIRSPPCAFSRNLQCGLRAQILTWYRHISSLWHGLCSPSFLSPPKHTQLTLIKGTELLKLCFCWEGQELGHEAGTAPQALPAAGLLCSLCLACTNTEHPDGKKKGNLVLGHHSWGAFSSKCLFTEAQHKSLHYKTMISWGWAEQQIPLKISLPLLQMHQILLRNNHYIIKIWGLSFFLISVFWFIFTTWKEEHQSVASMLEVYMEKQEDTGVD